MRTDTGVRELEKGNYFVKMDIISKHKEMFCFTFNQNIVVIKKYKIDFTLKNIV